MICATWPPINQCFLANITWLVQWLQPGDPGSICGGVALSFVSILNHDFKSLTPITDSVVIMMIENVQYFWSQKYDNWNICSLEFIYLSSFVIHGFSRGFFRHLYRKSHWQSLPRFISLKSMSLTSRFRSQTIEFVVHRLCAVQPSHPQPHHMPNWSFFTTSLHSIHLPSYLTLSCTAAGS